MISERELQEAIAEVEARPSSYDQCAKLATFYGIYDHLYSKPENVATVEENIIGEYGDSEFLKLVSGHKASAVMGTLDELMNVLKIIHPRLYNGVIRKLSQ